MRAVAILISRSWGRYHIARRDIISDRRLILTRYSLRHTNSLSLFPSHSYAFLRLPPPLLPVVDAAAAAVIVTRVSPLLRPSSVPDEQPTDRPLLLNVRDRLGVANSPARTHVRDIENSAIVVTAPRYSCDRAIAERKKCPRTIRNRCWTTMWPSIRRPRLKRRKQVNRLQAAYPSPDWLFYPFEKNPVGREGGSLSGRILLFSSKFAIVTCDSPLNPCHWF